MNAPNDHRIGIALSKSGTVRSYEDVLLIKSYISSLELIKSRFATMRSEQLDYLCRAINIEVFQPKVCIFQKGAYADKMYIVFSGCCSIVDSSSVGDKESSNECFSGMSFGGDELLADKSRVSSAFNDSATVLELLSVDRTSYLAFLADAYNANSHPASTQCSKGSLSHVMTILEKPRHIRTAADIETMAAFLSKEIPFFQQFHSDQLRELCLIVDAAKLWGQQLLFQQGQKGHAFYCILSGNVQVFVASEKSPGSEFASRKASLSEAAEDIGAMVTTLPKGITFGEQCEAALRNSTVRTGEGLTHLLVVDHMEYESLLPVIQSKEALEKVSLLRKTSLFQQMDASYLRSFSRYLQPISYNTEQTLYEEGWVKREDSKANMNNPGITVIIVGECRIDVEVVVNKSTSSSALSTQAFDSHGIPSPSPPLATTDFKSVRDKGKRSRVDLGRIGPGGVLYYFNPQDVDEEGMLHTETATAATPIHAYTISRADFFFKLESDTREAVIREIARDSGALKAVSDQEWRKNEAWVGFKRAMSRGERNKMENKNRSIIDSYRLLERMNFTSISLAATPIRKGPSMTSDGVFPLSPVAEESRSVGFSGDTQQGIRAGEYDEDIEFIRRSLGTSKIPAGVTKGRGRTAGWSAHPDGDVANSIRDMKMVSQSDVQKAIQRNKLRVGPKKHRLTFIQIRDRPAPSSTPPEPYAASTYPGPEAHKEGGGPDEEKDARSVKVLPFSLIHVHRETIKIPLDVTAVPSDDMRAVSRSSNQNDADNAAGTDLLQLGGRRKRLLRCHLRLCGTMRSPEAARECAEAQIQQAMLSSMTGGDIDQQTMQSQVVWRKFSGFEAIPSHHTDHFIVYCRSAPVEYGSITPSLMTGIDFLTQQIPFACKTAGQNFACFTARPITRDTASRTLTATAGPIPDPRDFSASFAPSVTRDGASYQNESTSSVTSKAHIWKRTVAVINTARYIEGSQRQSQKEIAINPAKLLEIKEASVDFIARNMGAREPGLAASNAIINREALLRFQKSTVPEPKVIYSMQNSTGGFGAEDFEVLDSDDEGSCVSMDESDSSSLESGLMNGLNSLNALGKPPKLFFRPNMDQQQRRRLAQPMFLLELSSFRETHATLVSRADCVAFTQSLVAKTNSHSSWYTCVAPLYEWISLDEATLRKLDIALCGIGLNATTPAGYSALSLESGPGSSNPVRFGPTSEVGVLVHSSSAKKITDKMADNPSQPPAAKSRSVDPQEGSSLGFGFALGGTQEAKDNRAVLLKNLIEARKGVLLSHDKLCLNEDTNRKREEKSSRFHLLPSIMYATNASCSQFDISLALKRRNVAKQHIKLLDTLVSSAPLRTVPAAVGEGANRNK